MTDTETPGNSGEIEYPLCDHCGERHRKTPRCSHCNGPMDCDTPWIHNGRFYCSQSCASRNAWVTGRA